jgi:hypothetical protein
MRYKCQSVGVRGLNNNIISALLYVFFFFFFFEFSKICDRNITLFYFLRSKILFIQYRNSFGPKSNIVLNHLNSSMWLAILVPQNEFSWQDDSHCLMYIHLLFLVLPTGRVPVHKHTEVPILYLYVYQLLSCICMVCVCILRIFFEVIFI